MATHTPAPWRLGGCDGNLWIERPNKADACICDIVQSGFEGDTFYTDEDECNARLIAAAPELLNACRLALTRLNDGTEVSAKVAEHVRAAIAKAEGGAK